MRRIEASDIETRRRRFNDEHQARPAARAMLRAERIRSQAFLTIMNDASHQSGMASRERKSR
jgi:hypothetical protein